MNERQKSDIRDYVIRRCLEELGFTPPKNQIRLLECSGYDLPVKDFRNKRVYKPDYVMFAVGEHEYQVGDQYFVRYNAYEEDLCRIMRT